MRSERRSALCGPRGARGRRERVRRDRRPGWRGGRPGLAAAAPPRPGGAGAGCGRAGRRRAAVSPPRASSAAAAAGPGAGLPLLAALRRPPLRAWPPGSRPGARATVELHLLSELLDWEADKTGALSLPPEEEFGHGHPNTENLESFSTPPSPEPQTDTFSPIRIVNQSGRV